MRIANDCLVTVAPNISLLRVRVPCRRFATLGKQLGVESALIAQVFNQEQKAHETRHGHHGHRPS